MIKKLILSPQAIYLLLLLTTFVVYGNTFLNDWTYDDRPVVVHNQDIRSLENFLDNTYKNRPLRELSYMLDYKIFGQEPAGYRVQQLLWHAANGCLLFLFMTVLGVAPIYGLLGTLLFLVHPLQVESVASIGHRKELLPLAFGFLMLLSYIKAFSSSGIKRSLLWLSAGLCYVLVLLGNVTAVTFPLLMVVYEWLFINRKRRILTRYPLLLGLALVAAASAAVYYYVQHYPFQRMLLSMYAQNGFAGTQSYLPLLLAVLKVPALYLVKLLWPVSLAPEYVVNFSLDWLQWGSFAGLILLIALMGIFWVSRQKMPVLSFAIAWCVILYIPVANFLPVNAHVMADRYLYMLLPGVSLGLAALLQKLSRSWMNGIIIILLVGLCGLTVVQNTHWKDDYSLWSHAVAVNPQSKGALWSMSQVHLDAGELPQAKAALNQVLSIDRFYINAYLALAKIYEREGNVAEAKQHYELFVRYAQFVSPGEAARVKNYLRVKFR